jgi:hypothetical protein
MMTSAVCPASEGCSIGRLRVALLTEVSVRRQRPAGERARLKERGVHLTAARDFGRATIMRRTATREAFVKGEENGYGEHRPRHARLSFPSRAGFESKSTQRRIV